MKASPEVPKTAAPLTEDYIPLFRQLAGPGNTAIVIAPSRAISGTYRAAWVAKQEFPDADIRVIDTGTISGSLGSLVLQALFWVETGLECRPDHERRDQYGSPRANLLPVDTLEYMRKGGRIGGAAALLGTIMGIKPSYLAGWQGRGL